MSANKPTQLQGQLYIVNKQYSKSTPSGNKFTEVHCHRNLWVSGRNTTNSRCVRCRIAQLWSHSALLSPLVWSSSVNLLPSALLSICRLPLLRHAWTRKQSISRKDLRPGCSKVDILLRSANIYTTGLVSRRPMSYDRDIQLLIELYSTFNKCLKYGTR